MEGILSNLEVLIRNNHILAFFAVFLGGVISSASPCVIAAIPLVIGYVGGYSDGDKKKAALFSLVYVIGLSLTFTVFGMFASFIGKYLMLLGKWVYIIFLAVAISMGLQLMGIINIPMPFQRSANVKRKGLLGAFILGIFTGTVSSPCATPILAIILTYTAIEGDIWYGGILLFVYAVGHCTLIFISGISVGIAESLIKSKNITNFSLWAKRAGGFLLMVVSIYISLRFLI